MAAVQLFPNLQGFLDAVFDAQSFTRRNRVAAFNAKTGFDATQLPFTLARDFQRRKFVLNTLPAVGSLCFFHVSLSRPEFPCARAMRAAKYFEGFENFLNVRWLGAGELTV
jgi:hypothetical protein